MPDPVIEWKLNDTLVSIREVGDIVINHRTMAVSQMSFRAAALFDSAPQFSYGDTVTLKKVVTAGEASSTTTVFTGYCDPVQRIATPDTEGHDFFVSCPWLRLEETIYQEEWAVPGGTPVMLPEAVLGLDGNGDPISVADQIAAAADYAGLSCTGGPAEILWPYKVEGVSCAEVIRMSLRLFPDYLVTINHATGNLVVTQRLAATARTIDVGDETCESVRYQERSDLVPEGVKIVYTTQQVVDGEVYRAGAIDVAGEDSGPRVIVATIPLAGTKMQFQKVPIQTRTLPDSQETAKDYLKERFPMLQNVTDSEWAITRWTKEVVPVSAAEEGDHETLTVNPQAVRLPGSSLTDLPRELVRGSVADWMRVKVGRIHIDLGVKATSTATAATIEALKKLPSGFTITATNAVTKIYKGLSQWEAGENAPVGLADAIYDSMTGAYPYEGEVTIVETECDAAAWMGCTLNLTGTSDSATATMRAGITSAQLDIASGRTTISFGPPAHLTPADFLELQRQLRLRPATWWSKEERSGDTLGHDVGPGSQGDTLMPYDVPEFVPDAKVESVLPFWPTLITEGEEGSETYKVIVTDGRVNERIPGEGDAVKIHKPGNIYEEGSTVALAEFVITDGQAVRVSVSVGEDGTIQLAEGAEEGATPVTIVVEDPSTESDHYQPQVDDESSDGVAGTMKYTLAKLVGGKLEYELAGSHIDHWQIPGIKSTGNGTEVIKKWNNAERKIEVRSVKGRYGIADNKADQIDLDLDAENIGSEDLIPGEASVYVDLGEEAPSDTKAQFRMLRGLGSTESSPTTPQIQVSEVGNTIRIKGNGFTKTTPIICNGVEVGAIGVDDGLVVSMPDSINLCCDCSSSGGGE